MVAANLYSVMNIIPDTNLVGTQYNWLGSAFYIGYLAAEYPVNRTYLTYAFRIMVNHLV